MAARSSLCSWVLGDVKESEGKAPVALNESHQEERRRKMGKGWRGPSRGGRAASTKLGDFWRTKWVPVHARVKDGLEKGAATQ